MSKLKRIILMLLCISVISSATIVIQAGTADHVCTKDMAVMNSGSRIGPQSYIYDSDMYHKVKYHASFHCSICGNQIGSWDYYELDGHKFTLYESQGHSGSEHTYKITCGLCGYSRSITIPCLYNGTGKHTTPW